MKRVKTLLVVNPAAGGGQVGRRWQDYNARISRWLGPAEVCFTQHIGHATDLVRSSLRAGFERIVVVGGDGTLNECVNGLFAADGSTLFGPEVSLVLYPAGLGGDFARCLGLRDADLADILHGATERAVDVGRAQFIDHAGRPSSRYFLNVASFGASGQIIDRVNRSHKRLGGRVQFWAASAQTLLTYRPQPVSLQLDGQPASTHLINSVAVANGCFFGGGMQIAPTAKLDDGLLDVVCIEDIGFWGFLRHSRAVYGGRILAVPGVSLRQGRRLTARPLCPEPVLLDLDGEQPGRLPATFELLPRKVRVYAPWERLKNRLQKDPLPPLRHSNPYA
jgi:diacylglycerol kinase (ATP)